MSLGVKPTSIGIPIGRGCNEAANHPTTLGVMKRMSAIKFPLTRTVTVVNYPDEYLVSDPPSLPSLFSPAAAGVGPLKIKYIALIGERHSGTTWMVKFLQDYFRNKDITVTATLCTWKVTWAGCLHVGQRCYLAIPTLWRGHCTACVCSRAL